MDDSDKKAFASRMVSCAEYYGQGEKMTKAMLSMWFEALRGYSVEAVGDALTRHMRDQETGRFMPKIADLLKWLEGDPEDLAREGWKSAIEAVRRVGHWQSVAFDDPLIAETINEIGGWQKLCGLEHEEMTWAEKDFIKRFASYKARGIASKHSGVLWGACDAQNRANGLTEHISAPIPIGRNHAKALENAKNAREGEKQAIASVGALMERMPAHLKGGA